MTDRRRGLGRGLGALIPGGRVDDSASAAHPEVGGRSGNEVTGLRLLSERADEPDDSDAGTSASTEADGLEPVDRIEIDGRVDGGARFAELDPDHITSNARQPRQVFDEDAHDELVRSIREVGMLQPVVVRPIAGVGDPRYELVMGERRWRAAQAAGLPTIPAIVRQTADDAMLRDALLENLHRSELNPLEEAAAYDQLLRDFGCTQDELAERIGRSRPQISNTIRLLRLPPSIQRRLAAGVLSAGHARALLGLPDAAAQERLAQRIVAEGLSVRTVEEVVAVGDLADGREPTVRARRPVAPALQDLAGRLSDRFETRVKVELGKRRGRITVEFGSIADLERIVAMMDPTGDPTVYPATEAPFTGSVEASDRSVDEAAESDLIVDHNPAAIPSWTGQAGDAGDPGHQPADQDQPDSPDVWRPHHEQSGDHDVIDAGDRSTAPGTPWTG